MDSVGEGEGGMIWENGIETCILSYELLMFHGKNFLFVYILFIKHIFW